MNIQLTPEQENLIQAKIQTGKYKSAQEVVAIALQLFDEYEQGETEWGKEARQEINTTLQTETNLENKERIPLEVLKQELGI